MGGFTYIPDDVLSALTVKKINSCERLIIDFCLRFPYSVVTAERVVQWARWSLPESSCMDCMHGLIENLNQKRVLLNKCGRMAVNRNVREWDVDLYHDQLTAAEREEEERLAVMTDEELAEWERQDSEEHKALYDAGLIEFEADPNDCNIMNELWRQYHEARMAENRARTENRA